MALLPEKEQKYIYKYLIEELNINAIEKWVYDNSIIEHYLTSDDYLELISLNFKACGSSQTVTKIFERYIDFGKFETWKMYRLLNQVVHKKNNYPFAIAEFYDLYCHGYYFLQNLGLGYSLSIEVPAKNIGSSACDDLTDKKYRQLVESMYPGIIEECMKIISWLDMKKLILTGEVLSYNRKSYIDNRNDQEKE